MVYVRGSGDSLLNVVQGESCGSSETAIEEVAQ